MTSPITAAALLLADKRVAVTLWAEVHKSNWSNILNIFQVVVTKTYIQRNLISVRESINIFVVKVISDGHSCFISGLLGTLHFAASCGIFFFLLHVCSGDFWFRAWILGCLFLLFWGFFGWLIGCFCFIVAANSGHFFYLKDNFLWWALSVWCGYEITDLFFLLECHWHRQTLTMS